MEVKELLDSRLLLYNSPGFIETDPISIPHKFHLLQDIEIMGLWTAVLSWGNRKTIINKSNVLIDLMDGAPYDFIINHKEKDLKRFEHFKHRTFNATDALYFIHFFKRYYDKHDSLEDAFYQFMKKDNINTANALIGFKKYFFSLEDSPQRTRKHISSPSINSSCKRLNMFLRWMVRKDENGVDLGLWNKFRPSQLLCPYDVHVSRVAYKLGLVTRKQTDFKAVLELTDSLKQLDPFDPVKYDISLFGLGIFEHY